MPRHRELEADRRFDDEPARPDRRAKERILALQRAAGNRAAGQVLARKASSGSKSPTVQFGKLAIQVAGGNLAKWAANEVPETLEVTSEKGRHSTELEHLSTDRTRIKSLTLTVAAVNKAGEALDLGSLAIEFTNARIKGYQVDGNTESWQVADFDGVHRTKTSHTIGDH